MILCIETATNTCSVALVNRENKFILRESNEERSHASLLTPFIEEILAEAGIGTGRLDAVVVSKGPGSYTGLRIGVSVAKGIAYASSVPLVAVNSLESMLYGLLMKKSAANSFDTNTLFCPMIDARRMDVYYALYDVEGKCHEETSAITVKNDTFASWLNKQPLLFFGTGSGKCTDIIIHRNAGFFSDFIISATSLGIPGYRALDEGRIEDTAYFEPFYLKDFIATIPRKNIIGNGS